MIKLRHDHAGITLSSVNLEDCIAWYSDNLDFAVTERFEGQGSTFTFLTNGDAKIELISAGAQSRNPRPGSLPDSHDVERLHHLCFAVDDVDVAIAELRDRGVEPLAGPMQIDQIGRRIAFITDNVGTIIELTAAT